MAVVDPGLAPVEAIEAFRAKGYQLGFSWQDVWKSEHAAGFTVAKAMDLDLLADIRSAVDQALAEGTTFEKFQKDLQPLLEERGWWGRKEVTDPKTGKRVLAQLGSPERLLRIFETNLRVSYAAGAWVRIQRVKDRFPYLRYTAVQDSLTRPEHAAWHGTILPVDDPWWKTHYPPNGWECRCRVIQLSERMMQRRGWKPSERPKVEWKNYRRWRDGEWRKVPDGVDAGWSYNVGDAAARVDEVRRHLGERVRQYWLPSGAPSSQKDYAEIWAADRKVGFAGGIRAHEAEALYLHGGLGAAGDYLADGYREINRRLAEKKKLTGRQAAVVAEMERLARPVGRRVLWRGIGAEKRLLKSKVGDVVNIDGALSTSTSVSRAFAFAEEGMIEVHTMPGARGLVWNAGEREVTLTPGHKLRVVRVSRITHNGQKMRHVTVMAEPPAVK